MMACTAGNLVTVKHDVSFTRPAMSAYLESTVAQTPCVLMKPMHRTPCTLRSLPAPGAAAAHGTWANEGLQSAGAGLQPSCCLLVVAASSAASWTPSDEVTTGHAVRPPPETLTPMLAPSSPEACMLVLNFKSRGHDDVQDGERARGRVRLAPWSDLKGAAHAQRQAVAPVS